MGAKLAPNSFHERVILVHNWAYEKLSEYKSCHEKVSVECKEHGVFEIEPHSLLSGHGCPKCAREERRRSLTMFLEKAKMVHKNTYSYTMIKPGWITGKIEVTCIDHGGFMVDADYFLKTNKDGSPKTGCPKCNKRQKIGNTLLG